MTGAPRPLTEEEIAALRETIGTWHTPDGMIERLLATLDDRDEVIVAMGKSLAATLPLDATRAPRSDDALRAALIDSLRTIHGDIVPLPNRASVEEYADVILRFLTPRDTPECPHCLPGHVNPHCPVHGIPRDTPEEPRPCARYWGSDGTLCTTHNGRFANDAAMRCDRREEPRQPHEHQWITENYAGFVPTPAYIERRRCVRCREWEEPHA